MAEPPQVIISFDMETDLGNWWTTYEGIRQGAPRLLDILDRQRVPATFLWTGDAAAAHPEWVAAARAAGHETGCHTLRHEFLGEANSDTPGLFTVLPEEIDHRLELATRAVEAVAGVRPVSFRCPRLQSSNEVLHALERLGYLTDGSYPTYFYARQFAPYHPSRVDWREPGDMAILELPTYADFSQEAPDLAGGYRRDLDCWPRLRLEGGAAMMGRIGAMGEWLAPRGLPNFVCLYLHPWEFVSTPRELVFGEGRFEVAEWLWINSGEPHLAALEELIVLLKKSGATFWTMWDYALQFGRRG